MLLLVSVLVFLSVTLLIGLLAVRFALAPRRTARGRLLDDSSAAYGAILNAATLQPQTARKWWQRILPGRSKGRLSELTVVGLRPDTPTARTLLYAGYRSRGALRTFQFTRLLMSQGLMGLALLAGKLSGMPPDATFLWIALGGLAGYVFPKIYIRLLAKRRQHRLKLSLPDALDLLVICVEAGMGLNQAIVRVSDELRITHPEISDEFRLVNLEIAAGRTRPEALRSLGERTGVDDIISLAAMIIQTDRFGTSIARSLRVHSDSLRVERRQRAEEAAAKTTIKLIFPLMFCVFPALFVTLLGPAALHLMTVFGESLVQ